MGQRIKVNIIKLERKLKYPSGNRPEIIKSNEDESIKVSVKDNEGNINDLFEGLVSNISIDVRTLEIEALSKTVLMDIEKKSRTFQKPLLFHNFFYLQRIKQSNGMMLQTKMLIYSYSGKIVSAYYIWIINSMVINSICVRGKR